MSQIGEKQQHKLHQKLGLISGVPEGYADHIRHEAPVCC